MSEHIASKKLYISVWATLIALTIATAGASYIELGPFNMVLALGIATTKMLLVALIFMGLKYVSDRMMLVLVVAGVFWLMILLVLGMTDYISRVWT